MSKGSIPKCRAVDFWNEQKRFSRRTKSIISSWFDWYSFFKVLDPKWCSGGPLSRYSTSLEASKNSTKSSSWDHHTPSPGNKKSLVLSKCACHELEYFLIRVFGIFVFFGGGSECAKRETCDCCFSTQFSDLNHFSSACKQMNMLLIMWAGR